MAAMHGKQITRLAMDDQQGRFQVSNNLHGVIIGQRLHSAVRDEVSLKIFIEQLLQGRIGPVAYFPLGREGDWPNATGRK